MGSATGPAQRRVYVCKHCFGVTRDMARVDELITELVVGRLSAPDAAELLVADHRADLKELRERAAALRARQDEAAALFADGAITAAQLKISTAKLSASLAEVEATMLDAHKARVFDGVIGTRDPAAVFDGLSLDRRRAMIDVLMIIIIAPVGRAAREFDPASMRIDWKTA